MPRRPPSPQKPEEALAWFAKQVPYTREERDALEEEERKKAFFVSNVAQVRVVSDVHKAVQKAIANGENLATFKTRVTAKLEREWGGEIPGRVETIFRTNVQSAYNAGRLEMFDDPVVKRFRPYRAWSVIVDRRTTEEICLPLRGVVVPADSAFAHSHIPPLHFNCRTGIMSVAGEELKGGRPTPPHSLPETSAQEGFGKDPRQQREPDVDLSDVPPALRRELARKTEKASRAAEAHAVERASSEPAHTRRGAPTKGKRPAEQ